MSKLFRNLKKQVKLALTPKNAQALLKKGVAQIAPSVMKKLRDPNFAGDDVAEAVDILADSKLAKKIEKSIMTGSGCRLCYNDIVSDDIDGEGFNDFLRGLSRGAKKVGKAIGKPLGNIGRAALKTGINTALQQFPVASQAMDFARNLQGGKLPDRYMIYDSYSNILSPLHPAMVQGSTYDEKGFSELGSFMPSETRRGRPAKQSGSSFRVL